MTTREAKELLEECVDLGNLTKWEESFLYSISDKLDRGKALSDYEEEKLVEIHKERTK